MSGSEGIHFSDSESKFQKIASSIRCANVLHGCRTIAISRVRREASSGTGIGVGEPFLRISRCTCFEIDQPRMNVGVEQAGLPVPLMIEYFEPLGAYLTEPLERPRGPSEICSRFSSRNRNRRKACSGSGRRAVRCQRQRARSSGLSRFHSNRVFGTRPIGDLVLSQCPHAFGEGHDQLVPIPDALHLLLVL